MMNGMRVCYGASIVALMLAVPDLTAQKSAPSRLVGWVSDGHCTTQHMKPGGESCARKCIAGATHLNPDWKPGGMVFVTEDKKVWKIDNPDALWGYESQRVEISAETNTEKESLKVVKFIGRKPAA
jgi:hypothetical protein